MSHIDTARSLDSAIFYGRLVRRAYDVLETVTAWTEARRTSRALHGLTDSQLDDLGLSRGDIEAVVRRGGRRF
ncbi:DUF1127 domain-containing protein [Wenxinia saemankumensis]|uniref:Uncharacterized conserved protein YjiS, DUF1127 family n=1 Tax=Wenxinia saemankumensis TaxID=1447782 RepID=A0A1M6BYZ1_9RHOB|nr:DUF1127 domain-containing protein [Wenxinia saemankumensis]SHI53942.1 Uncharacterized conserved protein YjiS, DUF1127 family [Wenxinia saemankumensis]